jgi:hypothetical protein
VIAKRFSHPEHRLQLLPSRLTGPTALVGRPCDLIQVSADRSQLGHRSLQCRELLRGKRCKVPQMRSDKDRNIRRRRHTRAAAVWHNSIRSSGASRMLKRASRLMLSRDSSLGNPSMPDRRSIASRSYLTGTDSVICSRSARARSSVFISGVTRSATTGGELIITEC